jgi:ribosomal protein L29
MKRNMLRDLRSKKLTDLEKMASEKRAEVDKARAEMKASKEQNLRKVKNLRRDLAQILTVVREKEIINEENKEEVSDEQKKSKK